MVSRNEDSQFSVVMAPYHYCQRLPGKLIRSRLIDAFDFWIKADGGQVTLVKSIIEQLHNASLIIDDIEDSAQRRRGFAATHVKFGIPLSINSANLAYFMALKEALSHPQLVPAVVEECINLHLGQGMEIYFRDSKICPSEQEYMEIISNKTGGLFRMAVKLLTIFVGIECEGLIRIADLLGEIYQIRDDYNNLFGHAADSEGFADDLIEGKYTLPIIHGNLKLNDDFKDLERRKEFVKKLTALGSNDYCIEMMDMRRRKIESIVKEECLESNAEFEFILNLLNPKNQD